MINLKNLDQISPKHQNLIIVLLKKHIIKQKDENKNIGLRF